VSEARACSVADRNDGRVSARASVVSTVPVDVARLIGRTSERTGSFKGREAEVMTRTVGRSSERASCFAA